MPRLALIAVLGTMALGVSHAGPSQTGPVTLHKTYAAEYDNAWDKIVSVVQETGGDIRFSDQDSRLMFYALGGPTATERYYLNVYVEPIAEPRTVVIYLVVHTWEGRSTAQVEKGFFEKLSQRLPEWGVSSR